MIGARARRRSKPSLLRRLRSLWIFIVVLVCAAAYAGYSLATSPAFQPKDIRVSGNVHVSADDVRKRAAIAFDRNIWLMNKGAAQRRIEALPWVRVATIHRTLPNVVNVVVEERKPVACVQSSGNRYLVDGAAHVLELGCAQDDVPALAWPALEPQRPGAVLDAALLQRMLADGAILHTNHLVPLRIGFDRFDGLEAELAGGLVVRFGDDRTLAEKAALVAPILRAYAGRVQTLAAIDLRAPATPVVELRRPKK